MEMDLRTGGPTWLPWRRVAVILAAGLILGVAAGLVLGTVRGPRHQAVASVMVQATPTSTLGLLINGTSDAISSGDMVDVALLATSTPLLTAAAEQVSAAGDHPDVTADDLADWVTSEPVLSSHLVQITVEAPEPALATAVLEALTTQLVDEQQAQVDAVVDSVALPEPGEVGTDPAAEQVRVRVGLVAQALVPLRVVSIGAPEQTAPGVVLPAALGVVGLAAGALVVIGASWRPRRPSGAGSEAGAGAGDGSGDDGGDGEPARTP